MKTHRFLDNSTFEGFQRSSNTLFSQRQRVPPTLYRSKSPFIPHETLGIIIPIELASSPLRVYVHIPTADLPDTATVSIKVRALDGSAGFASESLPISPPETMIIEIPQKHLKLFAGKELAIRYFVELSDEEPVGSEELFAKVTLPLVYTRPVVEGVIDSKLKVTDYPDGLDVTEAIIENLEYPSVVTCSWIVSLPVDGGSVELYSLEQRVPAAPGLPYCFRIPPQAYAFPSEVSCSCGVSVDFAPYDPDAETYGLGGYKISFVR
ncbi:hypothetical protein [Pseudomonas sp. Z2-11]